MDERRDDKLGARLDELEVQEHGPGYWEGVMAAAEPELERLRRESAAARTPGAAAVTAPLEDEAEAGARDAAAAGRRGRPIAAAVERHPTFGGGFRTGRWAVVLLAAAAVAAVVLLAGLPWRGEKGGEGGGLGPQPATAAQAIRYSLAALNAAQGLEGTVTVGHLKNGSYAQERAADFVVARDGSVRTTASDYPGHEATATYDALRATGEWLDDQSELVPSPIVEKGTSTYPRTWFARIRVAPAEPDRAAGGTGRDVQQVLQLRAYMRTMLADPGVRLQKREQGGREVWVLRTSAVGESSGSSPAPPSKVTIVIDAATRLPVSYVHRWDGHEPTEVVKFDVRPLADPPDREQFTIPKPDDPNTQIVDTWPMGDQGFRPLPFGDDAKVTTMTAGQPSFAAWLPRGFELAAGAAAKEGYIDDPDPKAPASATLPITTVSLLYRRGWDQVLVSTRVDSRLHSSSRMSPDGGKTWFRTDTSDPFVKDIEPSVAAQWKAHTTDVRLRAGAFAGTVAHIVVEPDVWPHLWVKKGPYVAAVAGDLTAAQMVRIAESLEPWKAAGGE